jgi:hypothetical protein
LKFCIPKSIYDGGEKGIQSRDEHSNIVFSNRSEWH